MIRVDLTTLAVVSQGVPESADGDPSQWRHEKYRAASVEVPQVCPAVCPDVAAEAEALFCGTCLTVTGPLADAFIACISVPRNVDENVLSEEGCACGGCLVALANEVVRSNIWVTSVLEKLEPKYYWKVRRRELSP